MSQVADDEIQVLISPQPAAPSLGILLFLSIMAFRKYNAITEYSSLKKGTAFPKKNENRLAEVWKSLKK